MFGADNAPDAEDVTTIKVAKPSVVVVGNEGAGLRTNVRTGVQPRGAHRGRRR